MRGMTNTRNEQYIHYNSTIFDNNTAVGAERDTNRNYYPKPRELVIQLGMKEVFFDFLIGMIHNDNQNPTAKKEAGFCIKE